MLIRLACIQMALLLGVALATPQSWGGVSRVGTASLRFENGQFEIGLPSNLKSYQVGRDEAVRFFTKSQNQFDRIRNPLDGGSTTVVDIYQLQEKYPELIMANRSEFARYFQNIGWTRLTQESSCFEVFTGQSDSAMSMIVSWGSGHGYLTVGTRGETAEQVLSDIYSSTRVLGEECRWK